MSLNPEAYGRAQAIMTDLLTTLQHDPEDSDIIWFLRTPLFDALAAEGSAVDTLFELAGIFGAVLHGGCRQDYTAEEAWRALCVAMAEDEDD